MIGIIISGHLLGLLLLLLRLHQRVALHLTRITSNLALALTLADSYSQCVLFRLREAFVKLRGHRRGLIVYSCPSFRLSAATVLLVNAIIFASFDLDW